MVNPFSELSLLYLRYLDYRIVLCMFYHLVDSGCIEGDVRLAGGETVMEGRVEVCHNQTWWAVCGYSSNWNYSDATVVCRHLHYPANCKSTIFQCFTCTS